MVDKNEDKDWKKWKEGCMKLRQLYVDLGKEKEEANKKIKQLEEKADFKYEGLKKSYQNLKVTFVFFICTFALFIKVTEFPDDTDLTLFT
mmetsp:Transcript_187/g.238  ORF Transcript_187/g.238 Transcript_187/m.238 type:complete len:90 (-) Transcript_187:131-400(-)